MSNILSAEFNDFLHGLLHLYSYHNCSIGVQLMLDYYVVFQNVQQRSEFMPKKANLCEH